MKRLACLAMLLCGCVSPQKDTRNVSTAGVQAAVESAACSARKATQRTEAAEGALRVAAAKSRELWTVASPSERPLVVQLETAVDETKTELNSAREQMNATEAALADSTRQTEALQNEISAMGAELNKARDEANRMQAARDFWRASAWKLALLALALGLWTFRRPLLALCGSPVL
jgi:chromosome segregation ATPase